MKNCIILIISFITITPLYSQNFYIQLGAFSKQHNAIKLYQEYKPIFDNIFFDTSDKKFVKVVIGPINNSYRLSNIINTLEEKQQPYFIKKEFKENKLIKPIKKNIVSKKYLQFSKEKFVENAKKYLGTKYVWGGKSPLEGFDCSGFVTYLLKQELIFFPHKAALIYKKTIPIKKNDIEPGDLVFFKKKNKIDHIGIMLNKELFIHSEYKNGVIISNINKPPYCNYPQFFTKITFEK